MYRVHKNTWLRVLLDRVKVHGTHKLHIQEFLRGPFYVVHINYAFKSFLDRAHVLGTHKKIPTVLQAPCPHVWPTYGEPTRCLEPLKILLLNAAHKHCANTKRPTTHQTRRQMPLIYNIHSAHKKMILTSYQAASPPFTSCYLIRLPSLTECHEYYTTWNFLLQPITWPRRYSLSHSWIANPC